MAQVPRYGELTVAPRALPGVRQDSAATPDLLNTGDGFAQLGKGLQRGGIELADVSVKLQERENLDLILRAETALRTEYIEFETQARGRLGQDAWGVTQDAKKWVDERAAKHGEGLTNDAQRRLYGQQVDKLRLQSLGTFSRHEADQRRASVVESATSSITSLTSLAAANAHRYLEPTRDAEGNVSVNANPVSAARDDIIKRVQSLAIANGWTPPIRDAEERKFLTTMHTQVINNLADSNPKLAKTYYADHKAEMDGRSYDIIDKVLKTGSLKRAVQEIADTVTSKGMTEAEALKYVREKYEGDEEAQGVIEVKTRFAEVSGARERMQKDAADEAEKIFAKAGRVSAIPSALWEKLDGRVQMYLREKQENAAERAANRADRAANRGERLPKTDWDKYATLRRQALEDPEAFRRRDLRLEFGHLGRGERESLLDLQAKKPEELRNVQTIDSQISATIRPLKLGTEENAVAEDAIRRQIDTEQQQRGKKLEPKEIQVVIDRMLVSGEVISGTGFWSAFQNDPNKRMYQTTPEERKKFKADIPAKYMPQILEVLKEERKPITDDNIIDLYNATLRSGKLK